MVDKSKLTEEEVSYIEGLEQQETLVKMISEEKVKYEKEYENIRNKKSRKSLEELNAEFGIEVYGILSEQEED